MKILCAVEPVDFRKGIDGLAAICRRHLETGPFSGCMFVFGNKSGTAIKILDYDGAGILALPEAAVAGRVRPAARKVGRRRQAADTHRPSLLIYNGDPDKVAAQPPWRKISEKRKNVKDTNEL